ncbi:alpha/beta hydrolase [Bacillus tamaricis]|uniref:Alpha/beta hydrolase n=1 Tax=Evansella tamaricis TaxID=2069301 RepID=A0ABS6JLD2_9BACI|nr:alpha/beta hydrolase [Evansella tamaricis]
MFSRKPDFLIPEDGISSVEKITLGGIEQTILIQGTNPNNPILLFLHGGPSLPTPGVSSRGQDYTITMNTKELVKNFVVVFWDQRGTGKSYSKTIPKETMSVSQFISDANDLTDYLRGRFHVDKIFLAGHSWGSILGLSLAHRHPEKYYSYVGLSQIVNWCENDKLSLVWAKEEAKRRNNNKALRELESVGEPPFLESFKQWGVLRKWQNRFGTLVYTDETIKHPGIAKITLAMLHSKVYSILDLYRTFVKGFQLVYTQSFIEEITTIDFKESVQEISIPITFIHGAKDNHVHIPLIEDYYEKIQAPKGKRLVFIEKSAHAFHPDDTKIVEKLLIEERKHITAENLGA